MRAFVLSMAMTTAAAAQQQDYSKVEIKTTKVAGNVWFLEGAGGNIAASAGEDGVAIVDDQFAELSPKIHAALAKLSPKPVRFVINTHWHFDHTGGNALFSDSAAILAHANVRKRLITGGKISAAFVIPPAAPAALPIVTFEEGLSLWWNGEEVRAIHLRPGHTDGDTAVWFTGSNVVHMGDDFITTGFPIVDVSSGGSLRGLLEALDSLLPQIPKDAKIIPGHGHVSTIDDLRKYRSSLEEMVAVVAKARKAGRTVEQMKADKLLAPWAEWGKGWVKEDAFIETIAQDLEHEQREREQRGKLIQKR
jgi:glyoxylase-like metal-dependent hydrolase (beta-lactamase superfamily II)